MKHIPFGTFVYNTFGYGWWLHTQLQWNQTPPVMDKSSGFVLCTLRKGSALCSLGNTSPISKTSQTVLDVHFTSENVLIIISSSSVTFDNVCNTV